MTRNYSENSRGKVSLDLKVDIVEMFYQRKFNLLPELCVSSVFRLPDKKKTSQKIEEIFEENPSGGDDFFSKLLKYHEAFDVNPKPIEGERFRSLKA